MGRVTATDLRGKGLVSEAVVADPTFLVAVGAAAATTVLFARRVGLPISTTHAFLALLVTAGWSGFDPRISLGIIAAAMAMGGTLRGRRVAETLSHGITSLSHGRGLLANSIASGLVFSASLLGSPVSSTDVSTGALFGIGLWNTSTDWSTIRGIVAAWVGTLPVAVALAAVLAFSLGWG